MLQETPATPTPGSDPTHYRDMEVLGDRIAELSALISAATFHLLTLIREFDERGGWACGFRSCAHWLSWRTGLSMGPAREKVRVARALTDLPKISKAIRRGEIPYSKVRALTRVATVETEERLLDFARAGTVSHVERLVRGWRTLDRNKEREQEAARHASRYLDTYVDDDGMVVVRGRLDPEAGRKRGHTTFPPFQSTRRFGVVERNVVCPLFLALLRSHPGGPTTGRRGGPRGGERTPGPGGS